ncbi:hypothetical protein AGLY_010568 [Aphis glycines]|uniref:Uncharacterized protein n=1 Tax=Aphis glycines TaxID=307491 RepID=A0A6G0TDY1_APHGL|nr:hypothetical protein AGLY_010568 [Aphis glycines]
MLIICIAYSIFIIKAIKRGKVAKDCITVRINNVGNGLISIKFCMTIANISCVNTDFSAKHNDDLNPLCVMQSKAQLDLLEDLSLNSKAFKIYFLSKPDIIGTKKLIVCKTRVIIASDPFGISSRTLENTAANLLSAINMKYRYKQAVVESSSHASDLTNRPISLYREKKTLKKILKYPSLSLSIMLITCDFKFVKSCHTVDRSELGKSDIDIHCNPALSKASLVFSSGATAASFKMLVT